MYHTPLSRIILSIMLLTGILINAYLVFAKITLAGQTGLIIKTSTLTISGLAAALVVAWVIVDTKAAARQSEHTNDPSPSVDIEAVKCAADEALDYQLKTYAATFVVNIRHATDGMTLDEVVQQAEELTPSGKHVLEAVMRGQPLDQIIDQFDTPEAALSVLMLTSEAVIQLPPNPKTAPI